MLTATSRLTSALRTLSARKMTSAPKCSPAQPLIAVIGATGTGKSQLAVELAACFNGEIINGDAMQLYDGLPIITNKIPVDERKGIPHHLLGCIGLDEPTWTVSEFVRQAQITIDEIRGKGKIPVLVGGTHYYTQALLFNETTLATETPRSEDISEVLERPTEDLLEHLRKVDPIMADRWHPNDRRKIQRSLEIFLKTGKTASATYADQSGTQDSAEAQNLCDGTPGVVEIKSTSDLRYPTLIFWVYAEREVLNRRLDARVLKMLDEGLLEEVRLLDGYLQARTAAGLPTDRTRGIWVSIGFKEFEAHQEASCDSSTAASDLDHMRSRGIEATQAATRQYAKSQSRWIRIKLLNALKEAGGLSNLFLLDASDVSNYNEVAVQPAINITNKFLHGDKLPAPTSLSTAAAEMLAGPKAQDLSKNRDLWLRQTCEVCGVTAVTEALWKRHVESNRHKKAITAQRRKEVNTPYLDARKESR